MSRCAHGVLPTKRRELRAVIERRAAAGILHVGESQIRSACRIGPSGMRQTFSPVSRPPEQALGKSVVVGKQARCSCPAPP